MKDQSKLSGETPGNAPGFSPDTHSSGAGEQVFGFHRPHRVGSICGPGCQQCGVATSMYNAEGEKVPRIPVFILRPATHAEYIASVIHGGGDPTDCPEPSCDLYFYAVSMD